MRKLVLAAAVACGLGAFGFPAEAQLLGTTVTGTIEFDGGPPNYYDPANGLVPTSGYDNSATAGNSATVPIDGNIEFGFQDIEDTITADFTDNTLTVTDAVGATGNGGWEQTFTDPAFSGLSLSTVSDTFDPTTATLAGDVITIDWDGTDGSGDFSATYALVPEPASLMLLATGLVGLGAMRRSRRA